MGDRDAVGGDQQPDHDLGPVGPVVSAVAEGEGWKTPLTDGHGLEVTRGDVVADKAEIEVGEVAQLLVEVHLGGVFCLGDGVDRPVALVEPRWADAGRKGDGTKPFGDGPPLGSRICEAVRHHREHGVGEHPRSPAVADRREVLVEAQATEVRPDRCCRTEARRAFAGQLTSLEPVPLRVGTKRPDDPVYLPARAQLGDLPKAQERAVGVATILPDSLDERQILVGLVATATHRPLHKHNHILRHCKSDTVDVSPLHSRSKVWTYPQLAQVRGLGGVPRTKVAPKSGRKASQLPMADRNGTRRRFEQSCSRTRPDRGSATVTRCSHRAAAAKE